jgi:cold shock CspA family protein
VENFPLSPPRKTGYVKWATVKKNYTYLVMPDGQDVYIHKDDFEGDWPPPYRRTVEFDLLEVNHPRCKYRAKEAQLR